MSQDTQWPHGSFQIRARRLFRLMRWPALLILTACPRPVEPANLGSCALPPYEVSSMSANNVLGQPLRPCSVRPLTGYFRDGTCSTGPTDHGTHVVCAQMTAEFLEFTRGRGNDLSTPRPEHRFPGLKPGDSWCLCASRWREAHLAGVAPPVHLERTHEKALEFVTLDDLLTHALVEGE